MDRVSLDDIDWSSVSHAYGPATDVPGLIRGLASKKAPEALGELFGSITHQGTRYSATAVAVPFLVDAALDPAVTVRFEILALVGFCALGFVSDDLDAAAQRSGLAAGAERDSLAAVVREHPRLRTLVADPDDRLRRAALTVLVWTGDDDQAVLDALDRHLVSAVWQDRLTSWLGHVVLGREPARELLRQVPDEPDRFGWAAAAVRYLGASCPEQAIDELTRVFDSVESGAELTECEFLSVLGEDPAHLAALALSRVPVELRAYASNVLLRSIATGFVMGEEPLDVYLRLNFGMPEEDRLGPASLRTEHLRALEALAEALDGWTDRQPPWQLRDYGLPPSGHELRSWIRERRRAM